LKGWVMMDKACDRCYNPLMRSPRNQAPVEIVCASCDQSAAGPSSQLDSHINTVESSNASISLGGESRSVAEVSTPMTDFSEGLPSPPLPLPPPETEELLHRRAQSDQASAEIGRRLLQGWTMLADECPRSTCYGIPLVRPPRSKDGTISKTKECVVCGTNYNPDGVHREPEVQHHPPTIPSVPSEQMVLLENRGPTEHLGINTPSKPISKPVENPPTTTEDSLTFSSAILTNAIFTLTDQLKSLNSKRPIPYSEMKALAETISALARALQEIQVANKGLY